MSVCLSDQHTGPAALAFARELAAQAAGFAAEVERLHARDHDGDGGACTACQGRGDGEAA